MPGGMELKNQVLMNKICTLCGACLDWCPYLKNLEDHLIMRFDCNVLNGRCYAVCPRTFTDWQAINEKFLVQTVYTDEIGSWNKVYKVKSKVPVRGQQDGGAVSSLLRTALEDKMVGAALLTGAEEAQKLNPVPFISSDVKDIEKSAGSRFLASPGLRKITAAEQNGIEKIVAVGRPCQIQALRKMQFNHPADKKPLDILSIGLFCMWSLSWSFKDYLSRVYPGVSVTKMAILQHGVELITDEGIKTIPLEKVKDFIRPACLYCLDMTSELADISVGAFEAVPGFNIVIVRSERGIELLQKAEEKGYIIMAKYPDHELVRLKSASYNKKIRALKHIKRAAENEGLKPFIDLEQGLYKKILDKEEGVVNS